MKLNEFHIDEFRASLISKRVSISGVFPAVAGDFVRPPNPTSREHDCFGTEDLEAPSLTFITKRANHSFSLFQERQNGVLHVDINSLMHAVILQRPDRKSTRLNSSHIPLSR